MDGDVAPVTTSASGIESTTAVALAAAGEEVDAFMNEKFALAMRALYEAVLRLREADRDRDAVGCAIALTESLVWVVALDDALGKDKAYRLARDADDNGRVIRGLRWARNRSVHRLDVLHEEVIGTSRLAESVPVHSRDDGLMWVRALRWRSVEAVQGRGRRGDRGEDDYREFLAERTVASTLPYAYNFFRRCLGADAEPSIVVEEDS